MPFSERPLRPLPLAAPGEKGKSGITLLAAALIVAAGLAAYSNSLRGQFIYDDLASILDNRSIRHLWPPGTVLTPPHGAGWTVEGSAGS